MKKIILSLVLLMTVVAMLPVLANAETTQEQEISKFVSKQNKIAEAKCVVYQRNCVVAIKAEKFVSKAEYDNFKQTVRQEICKKFNLDNVLITRNPRAMHAIGEISKLSEQEREEAVRKFVEFEFEHKPHRPEIQPR